MTDRDKKLFKYGILFAAIIILIYAMATNATTVISVLLKIISVFSPLMIGAIIALILYKPMKSLYNFISFLNKKSKLKKKLPEKAMSVISLIVTLIVAFVLLYFIGNSIVPEIVDSVERIIKTVETFLPTALTYLEGAGFDTSDLRGLIEQIDIMAIWDKVTAGSNVIFETAMGAVNGIASLAVTVVSSIIFSVYLLSNREVLKRQTGKTLDAYLNPRASATVKKVGMLTVNAFMNFFSGQCLEAVILGLIFFVAMSIFAFPYAIVISVVIAVTSIIPYVGAFIGCIVGAFLILMQSPMKALLFVVMFLIIQQLENHIIYPKVVGASVNLPAIWTFAALIVGGGFFGVPGMLVFVPMTSVAYSLLREDVNKRISQKTSSSDPDGE